MESEMAQNSTSNFSITFNKYDQIQDHVFIKINKCDLIQPKKFNQLQRKVKNRSQSTKKMTRFNSLRFQRITFKKNEKLCQQIPRASTNVVALGQTGATLFVSRWRTEILRENGSCFFTSLLSILNDCECVPRTLCREAAWSSGLGSWI